MSSTGGCRCGAVTYTLDPDATVSVYACHCLDCQTSSGSAFGEYALLPEAAMTVQGTTDSLASKGTDGTRVDRHVCGRCHTGLWKTNSAVPGLVVLQAGTLTASDGIEPVAHIWTRRRQSWVHIAEGVPQWPETSTPEEFGAALQARAGG